MSKRVIVDCDTGIDDAIALLLCFRHLDVVGITTVAGNVALANTQRNTRYVTELAGRQDIPVYAGCDRPLLVPLETAAAVHGAGGLGDIEIPQPAKQLEELHAVDYLIRTYADSANRDITLVTIGPLTNVALALLREPRLAEWIPEIMCMGGSLTYGNHTPAAEFNVYADPEAAKIVFEAGIPLRMVGLNLTRQNAMTMQDVETLRDIGNAPAAFAARLLDYVVRQDGRGCLCDACAVMWLIEPSVITKSLPLHVVVETRGEFTRGMTLCDYRHLIGSDPARDIEHAPQYTAHGAPPNVTVALEMDLAAFNKVLFDTMNSYTQ